MRGVEGGEMAGEMRKEQEECEAEMKQKDAVLEPNALDTAQHFVRSAGANTYAIRTAIQLFSSSYVGYARMASVVCSWLARARQQAGRQSGESASDCVVTFVGELVHKKFDPEAVDPLFRQGQDEPFWVRSLLQAPRARNTCLQLAHQHTESTFLEFIIMSAWHLGFKEEVAALGSTAANSVTVFAQIMEEHVHALCSATCAEEQMKGVHGLCRLCKHSAIAYTVCQLTLAVLQRSHTSDSIRRIFRRASQDLERAAEVPDAAGSDATVLVITPLLAEVDQHHAYRIIVQLLSSQSGSELELLRALHALVPAFNVETAKSSSNGNATIDKADESLRESLRYYRLLEYLARIVFAYNVRRNSERWSKSADLLCYICSASDWRRTREQIVKLLQHLDEASRGTVIDRSSAKQLLQADCICAWGACYFAQQAMQYSEHATSVRRSEITLAYCVFVLESCRAFHSVCPQAMRAVRSGLDCASELRFDGEDVQTQLLDLCVILAQNIPGCAVQHVLPMAESWAAEKGEPSVVRHFGLKLISTLGEPRSATLVSQIIRTLSHGSAVRQRTLDESIREFLLRSMRGDGISENSGSLRKFDLELADKIIDNR